MKFSTASVIVLTSVLLAACGGAPVVRPDSTAALEAEAEAAVVRGDLRSARDIYRDLADRNSGDLRRSYELDLARIEIELGDPAAALDLLAADASVPETLRPEFMAVRAAALFAQGRTVEAVRELIERGIWLDTAADILANQTLIWNGLATAPVDAPGPAPTGDSIVDGWLALTPISRLSEGSDAFGRGLIGWRQQFGAHPAASGILAERLASLRAEGARPQRIALLLPLSAADIRLRRSALALRDGFFAAHFATGAGSTTTVDVYDTARGSLSAYRAAQAAGSDFIVGPLLAASVREIIPEAGLTPTLALNIGDEQQAPALNFYQFALSSDDELDAIATRAIAEGHRTAVILHAPGARGSRIRDGFRERFEARGGAVIASRVYNTGASDLSAPIVELLNIGRSEARFDRLRANLGGIGIEFEPRRRADIDMIFLQADPDGGPEDARLLVPVLARSGAEDIPTYATSEVFDPNRSAAEPDLDGLLFPDLPLLVDPVGAAIDASRQLEQYESQSTREFKRLYAFGFDAYALTELLFNRDPSAWPLDGATGQLHLGDNGRIRRILPLARISNGRPTPASPGFDLLSAR